MLFHTSIPARDPGHVATVLGEIWGGRVVPSAPAPGSFVVVTEGAAAMHLEVHPARPEPGPAEGVKLGGLDPVVGTHVRLGVPCGERELHRIVRHEGWRSRTTRREGTFRVAEIWLENWFMLEALTPDMQDEYRASLEPAPC